MRKTWQARSEKISVKAQLPDRSKQPTKRDMEMPSRLSDLLIRSVMDFAIYMLDPEGCVASWNPGAEHLHGYRSDEITGRSFSCFYTDEDQAAGLPQQALETATKTGRFSVE